MFTVFTWDESPDACHTSTGKEKLPLKTLQNAVVTSWGSVLLFSGCWVHCTGGSCGGKEVRTYQS